MEASPEMILFLQRYNPEVHRLALKTRQLIMDEIEDVIEILDEKSHIIAYGFGNKYIDNICTIILSQKHIKLGFYRGSQLPDPRHLMSGTGKIHSYIVIESTENFEYIKDILAHAMTAYKQRKEE